MDLEEKRPARTAQIYWGDLVDTITKMAVYLQQIVFRLLQATATRRKAFYCYFCLWRHRVISFYAEMNAIIPPNNLI